MLIQNVRGLANVRALTKRLLGMINDLLNGIPVCGIYLGIERAFC